MYFASILASIHVYKVCCHRRSHRAATGGADAVDRLCWEIQINRLMGTLGAPRQRPAVRRGVLRAIWPDASEISPCCGAVGALWDSTVGADWWKFCPLCRVAWGGAAEHKPAGAALHWAWARVADYHAAVRVGALLQAPGAPLPSEACEAPHAPSTRCHGWHMPVRGSGGLERLTLPQPARYAADDAAITTIVAADGVTADAWAAPLDGFSLAPIVRRESVSVINAIAAMQATARNSTEMGLITDIVRRMWLRLPWDDEQALSPAALTLIDRGTRVLGGPPPQGSITRAGE